MPPHPRPEPVHLVTPKTKRLKTDVTRTPAQYIGDIGELKVVELFLRMGCSVNYLTGSDYGLDLHVQMPESPTVAATMTKSWAISGRTAHIQVKNSTSTSSPSVDVPTLRTWVTGSRTGTPTLLVCLFGTEKRFATPWHFIEKLSEVDAATKQPATKSFGKRSTLKLEEQTFSYLLQLWTRYPGLMMMARIDSWSAGKNATTQLKMLVAELCYAWAMDHRLPGDSDTVAVNRLTDLAVGLAATVSPGQDHWVFAQEILGLIEDQHEDIKTNNKGKLEQFESEYASRLANANGRNDEKDRIVAVQSLAVERQGLANAVRSSPWPEPRYRRVYATSTSHRGSADEVHSLVVQLANYRTLLTESPSGK